MYLKNEKGVTLVALTVTIIVMLILSSVIIHSSNTHINTQKRDKLYSDIDNLNNKISEYYMEYNDIPVLSKKYCSKEELEDILNNNISSHNVELNNSTDDNSAIINPNDDDSYYIIDLEELSGLTLNYGYDEEYKNAKQSEDNISTNVKDFYIINKATHQIYYPKGIYTEDYMYYCYDLDYKEIALNVNDLMAWRFKKDSNGKETIITNGTIDLPVGTYINYNATAMDLEGEISTEETVTSDGGSSVETETTFFYKASEKALSEGNGIGNQTFSNKAETGGWRVLGTDRKTGELLIISADTIQSTDNNDFFLRGIAGYTYGVSELNKICSIFGNGYGATKARSVNVDDINRITGFNPNNVGKYDPNQVGTGTKFENGQPCEYGNQTTYKWSSDENKVIWNASNGENGFGISVDHNKYGFNWYDTTSKIWKNSMQDTTNPLNITTLISTGYWYYPDSLNKSAGTGEGLDVESNEYKLLFKNKAGTNINYWLASSYVNTTNYYADFGMNFVLSDSYVGEMSFYYSYGYVDGAGNSIRPVVSLRTDIELEKQEDGSYNIIK